MIYDVIYLLVVLIEKSAFSATVVKGILCH